MIITQESPVSSQILTLVKPLGKDIPLRIGEIIEGQVLDIYPSGGLTLRVKGSFLTVRSDLLFEKNETLLLKVLGQGKKNGEFVLQLIIQKKHPEGEGQRGINGLTKEGSTSSKSSDWLGRILGPRRENLKELSGFFWENSKLKNVLSELSKSLPSNIQSIPKGLKLQLQQVLQTSLQESAFDIQEKILQLINLLSGSESQLPLVNQLKENLVFMESMDFLKLKMAIENSGVLLEPKLKVLTRSQMENGSGVLKEHQKIQQDFKALLLKLFNGIQGKNGDLSSVSLQTIMAEDETIRVGEPGDSAKVLGMVQTLIKDVETFQLLSKISDALHTYLPVRWEALKHGELLFKRKDHPKGLAYSCGIHLDLEKLGPVSVFLLMQSRNFYIKFKTDHPGLKKAIQDHLEELKENFKRMGLNLQSFTIVKKEESHPDLWERMEYEETLIDIRI